MSCIHFENTVVIILKHPYINQNEAYASFSMLNLGVNTRSLSSLTVESLTKNTLPGNVCWNSGRTSMLAGVFDSEGHWAFWILFILCQRMFLEGIHSGVCEGAKLIAWLHDLVPYSMQNGKRYSLSVFGFVPLLHGLFSPPCGIVIFRIAIFGF